MEKKKNSKADLEKSKSIFFLIGLVVASGLVFAAFNISTKTSPIKDIGGISEVFIEDDPIMPTRHPEEIEVIKPTPQVIEALNIVDDTEETRDIEIFDPEDDGSEVIDFNTIIELKKEKPDEIILNFASTMPIFPGGEIGLRKYIFNNVKYPIAAREGGIEGKVYIRFCVTKTGNVEKVSIARGVDPLLDNEAIRVVRKLPKWKPGENGGRKVSVWYTVPIAFKINN